MTTQDIRDRLLRVTRELLECVTELNANQHERLATRLEHMGEPSPSGDDVIVHETWRCGVCGERNPRWLSNGSAICATCEGPK